MAHITKGIGGLIIVRDVKEADCEKPTLSSSGCSNRNCPFWVAFTLYFCRGSSITSTNQANQLQIFDFMNLCQQIAKHLREVHVGKNWTWVNLKETLEGVHWQHAMTKVKHFNTIATLVYHMNYYIEAQLNLLKTGLLDAHDDFAFKVPPINSASDWQKLTQKSFDQAEELAQMIENLPDSKLWEICVSEKYGNYYRNFHGMIEHCHYHLGQIVFLKKLIIE